MNGTKRLPRSRLDSRAHAGAITAALPPAVFAAAPTAMAVLDLAGTIADANAALGALCDAGAATLIGRPFVDLLAAEDRDQVGQRLARLGVGAAATARCEFVRVHVVRGRWHPVSLHMHVLADEAGHPRALVVHVQDREDRLALDEHRLQAHKLQAVGELAGGIAHDFNNVLTAILGLCDLVLDRYAPGDETYEDVRELRHSATRGSNLVRQLLAFARGQSWRPQVVDANVALAELSLMLGRLLGDHIALDLRLEAEDGLVFVDPGHFDQIVINIAVNARDAMPGGGCVGIVTNDVVVDRIVATTIGDVTPGRYVLIEIADNGCGIPKDVLPRIFDPFFTTKASGAGTGLGLSTVDGLVRQSHGSMVVDSVVGIGTTFGIYLPVPPQAAVKPVAAAVEPLPPGTGAMCAGDATVLLVEDETAVRVLAARALRARGYRVLEADSGTSALDILRADGAGIDVIVSDVVMPGMDGHALADRARCAMPGIRVILMSGYSDQGTGASVDADDAMAFLAKPFSLADLVDKVADLLAR